MKVHSSRLVARALTDIHERRRQSARLAALIGVACSSLAGWGASDARAVRPPPPPPLTFDVVVYGGTPSGVMTALAAARGGARVALLEPGTHLGGMVSGGLGWTDVGGGDVIGGYARGFFHRVALKTDPALALEFAVEPHIAAEVFGDLVKEPGISVFFLHRLKEGDGAGVHKTGTIITSITMEDGQDFAAKEFVDTSYEGDLMAQAKVPYVTGREPADKYGESLAGVREFTPKHQFEVDVAARDDSGKVLDGISDIPKEDPGTGDKKIQAYNFRICMTKTLGNVAEFPKPVGYDAAKYALLAKTLVAMDIAKQAAKAAGDRGLPLAGDPPVKALLPWNIRDLFVVGELPHGKFDMNNNGAVSTDYIGGSYGYPDGDYATRARIWQAHVDYDQGLLYFLFNDVTVPKPVHELMQEWGLCADEFRLPDKEPDIGANRVKDMSNWPTQLYVREGRRMVGEYVMTQKDIQKDLLKPDAVGMGSYNSDSHNVQRFINASGMAENEGDMQVPVSPYQIPYRVMVPPATSVTNLLVPVCLSASHVAYSSLRMEPQYMILGQAAGVAVTMAIDAETSVQAIDTIELTARLRAQGARLEWPLAP